MESTVDPRPQAASQPAAPPQWPVALRWAVAIAAVAAALLTLLATWHGPGVTADSVNYLWMARNLARGDALRGVGGTELTVFPPGYPALLAIGRSLGLGALATARLLAALSSAAVVALTAAAVAPHARGRRGVVAACTAVVLVAPAMWSVQHMAWSEGPFVAVVMAALVLADRGSRGAGPSRSLVLGLAALIWAAYLLRYAGVVLVPVVALSWRRRPSDALRLVLWSLVVPILWSGRNLMVDGSLMGPRNSSSATALGDLAELVATGARWTAPTPTAVACAVVALVALVALAWPRKAVGGARRGGQGELVVWTTFVLAFTALTVVSHLSTQLDALGDRLLVPLLAPLVVLAGAAVARLADAHPTRRSALRVLGAATWAWVGVCLLVGLADLRAGIERGPSHLVRRFGDSPLVEWVHGSAPQGAVLSNQAEALAFGSGREVVLDPPAVAPYGWTSPDPSGDRLVELLGCRGSALLVWFDDAPAQFLDPQRYPDAVRRTTVLVTDDGRVERLELADPGESSGCGG